MLLVSVGVRSLSICYLNHGMIRTRISLFGQKIPSCNTSNAHFHFLNIIINIHIGGQSSILQCISMGRDLLRLYVIMLYIRLGLDILSYTIHLTLTLILRSQMLPPQLLVTLNPMSPWPLVSLLTPGHFLATGLEQSYWKSPEMAVKPAKAARNFRTGL